MRKNYVLRLATFTLILALLVGTGSVSAYGYEEELHFTHDQSLDSLDLEEETTNDEQSSNSLTLEFIEEIDNVKENIFNNMLDSVDFYDAVEGEFITTLWDDPEDENHSENSATTISYVSNIPAQESYQMISENGEIATTEVYVTEGKQYTFNNLTRSYRIDDIGVLDVTSEREKKDANICLQAATGRQTSISSRIGSKDGAPVYRYRNDLTNTNYAAVSLFPQTLTFGLLTNQEDWEIIGTDTYIDRDAITIQGVVSDPVYSAKINSVTFTLTVDVETGIILEFVGYDADGNETESIKTTEISIIQDASVNRNNLTGFISEALENYDGYTEERRNHEWIPIDDSAENTVELTATRGDSISCLIDNDTIDSDYYNERYGFLAYLNDSNYYNEDMRRTYSDEGDDGYCWYTESPLDHESRDDIDVDLDIYLYSSTSRDPAANYYLDSMGDVTIVGKRVCVFDQSTSPNGWNSFSRSVFYGFPGEVWGISIYPSGSGSTYTGADAVNFYAEIS